MKRLKSRTKGKKKKEFVREHLELIRESLLAIEKGEEDLEKHLKIIADDLEFFTEFYLSGEEEEEIINDCVTYTLSEDMIPLIISNLAKLGFESKRLAAELVNFTLHRKINGRFVTVSYLVSKPELLFSLCEKSGDEEISIHCGSMLRQILRYKRLATILINDQRVYSFFDRMLLPDFATSSDSYATFKDLLVTHAPVTIQFLEANYDEFFSHYNRLLTADNIVVKTQALELLGQLLRITCVDTQVERRFVLSEENLTMIMKFLVNKSEAIQSSSMLIFSLFLSSPVNPEVHSILIRNREKLISFFEGDPAAEEEEAKNAEKANIVKQLKSLSDSYDEIVAKEVELQKEREARRKQRESQVKRKRSQAGKKKLRERTSSNNLAKDRGKKVLTVVV